MFYIFFRALLLSMLSMSILNAKIPFLSNKLSDKVELVSEEIGDFFQFESLGKSSLSAENEAFVRSSIDEIGINRKVVIRKFNDKMLAVGMSKNAATFDFGTIIYIYFDEDFFNTLTQEEKKFIVFHEISHAKRLHIPLRVVAMGAIIPMLVKLANEYVFSGQLDKETLPMAYICTNWNFPEFSRVQWFNSQLSFLGSLFLISKFSKLTEFDADLNAARNLGMIDGGVSFFERLISDRDSESRFRVKRICNRIISTIRSFFATHPTHEQRIDFLKKFEKDRDASLLQLLIRHYYDMVKKGCTNFSTNVKLAIA